MTATTIAARSVAGVCRFCGCSEFDPCLVDTIVDVEGCRWTDVGRRVCSVCAPAAAAEGRMVRLARGAGYALTPAWLSAYHRGFIVGWFVVTPRSPYGRNPYARRGPTVLSTAWHMGQRQSTEARRVHERMFGAITNRRRALRRRRGAVGLGRRSPRRR